MLREGSDATVVATLLMAARSLEAAEALAAEGLDVEVIDLQWLRPMDVDAVHRSLARTGAPDRRRGTAPSRAAGARP